MRGDAHVRFGGRVGETDAPKDAHRAPTRPNSTPSIRVKVQSASPSEIRLIANVEAGLTPVIASSAEVVVEPLDRFCERVGECGAVMLVELPLGEHDGQMLEQPSADHAPVSVLYESSLGVK